MNLEIPLRPHNGKRGGLEAYEKIENPALQQMLAHHKSNLQIEGRPFTTAVYTLQSFQKVQTFLDKTLNEICQLFEAAKGYLR